MIAANADSWLQASARVETRSLGAENKSVTARTFIHFRPPQALKDKLPARLPSANAHIPAEAFWRSIICGVETPVLAASYRIISVLLRTMGS